MTLDDSLPGKLTLFPAFRARIGSIRRTLHAVGEVDTVEQKFECPMSLSAPRDLGTEQYDASPCLSWLRRSPRPDPGSAVPRQPLRSGVGVSIQATAFEPCPRLGQETERFAMVEEMSTVVRAVAERMQYRPHGPAEDRRHVANLSGRQDRAPSPTRSVSAFGIGGPRCAERVDEPIAASFRRSRRLLHFGNGFERR